MRVEWNGEGKLTKKRALFLCWQLWEWLGESEDNRKTEWPEWENKGGRVAYCDSFCPCCEYNGNTMGERKCSSCPLGDYWPKLKYRRIAKCEEPASPYNQWLETHKPKFARQIAAASKRRYEKL